MNLLDIVGRDPAPAPWAEGESIPWNEPGFSARMLREHLTQDHDHASRRAERIDLHVAWIHAALLGGRPGRVLDLGCGPGLYAARLARMGHDVLGVDFSPASVAYAREAAGREGLSCEFVEADLRAAEYGSGYDLAMLIFGELNVFRPAHARAILAKARAALAPGGMLLLEPHTYAAVRRMGDKPPGWYASPAGLFSPQPHLVLEEHFWDQAAAAATTRFFVVDAASGAVQRLAESAQAYTDDQYADLLRSCGFADPRFFPSLTGEASGAHEGLFALVAARGGA